MLYYWRYGRTHYMTSNIVSGVPTHDSPQTVDIRNNFDIAKTEISLLQTQVAALQNSLAPAVKNGKYYGFVHNQNNDTAWGNYWTDYLSVQASASVSTGTGFTWHPGLTLQLDDGVYFASESAMRPLMGTGEGRFRGNWGIRGQGSRRTVLRPEVEAASAYWMCYDSDFNLAYFNISGISLAGRGTSNPYQMGLCINPNKTTNALVAAQSAFFNLNDVQVFGFCGGPALLYGGANGIYTSMSNGKLNDCQFIGMDSQLASPSHLLGCTGLTVMGQFGQMRSEGCIFNDAGLNARASMGIYVSRGMYREMYGSLNGFTVTESILGNGVFNIITTALPHRQKTGGGFKLTGSTCTFAGANASFPSATQRYCRVVTDYKLAVFSTAAGAYANDAGALRVNLKPAGTEVIGNGIMRWSNQTVAPAGITLIKPDFYGNSPQNQSVVVQGGNVTIVDANVEDTGGFVLAGDEGNDAIGSPSIATVIGAGAYYGNPALNGGAFLKTNSMDAKIMWDGGGFRIGTVGDWMVGNVQVIGGQGYGTSSTTAALSAAAAVGTLQTVPIVVPGTTGTSAINLFSTYTATFGAGPNTTTTAGRSVLVATNNRVQVTDMNCDTAPGGSLFFILSSGTDPGNKYLRIANTGRFSFAATYPNNELRMPVDARWTAEVQEAAGNYVYRVTNIQMPSHSASWVVTSTATGLITNAVNITCAGAQVGDTSPTVSTSVALPTGVMLFASVTATDTVTVYALNMSGSTWNPGTITATVVQTR
jgi:hypothetical protein